MHSVSEENYIKAIYHAQQGDELVSTNEIAARMNTKASSVTDMLKKLADKQLADYVPYKGTRLTQDGLNCATQIIRKHRLWEVFLVEKLEFSWDEVHEVAEQLEHIQSRKLINQLDKLLGFPKRDPHGDPIPDSDGNFETVSNVVLSQLDKHEQGSVVGVIDTSRTFLKYLDKHHIQLGTVIKVLEHEEYDHSMIIEFSNKKLTISQQTAENLYIKKNS
jgi:DtxR family Mn-dependent transcriptional regulator